MPTDAIYITRAVKMDHRLQAGRGSRPSTLISSFLRVDGRSITSIDRPGPKVIARQVVYVHKLSYMSICYAPSKVLQIKAFIMRYMQTLIYATPRSALYEVKQKVSPESILPGKMASKVFAAPSDQAPFSEPAKQSLRSSTHP